MLHNNNPWSSSDTGGTGDEAQLNEQAQNGGDETNQEQFGQILADSAVLSNLNGSPGDLWLLSDYIQNKAGTL